MKKLFILIILLISTSSFAKNNHQLKTSVRTQVPSIETIKQNRIKFDEHTFQSKKHQLNLIGLEKFEYDIYSYSEKDIPNVNINSLEARND